MTRGGCIFGTGSTQRYHIVLSVDCPRIFDFCFLGHDRLLVVAVNLRLYSIEDISKTPELLASFVVPCQLLYATACLLPVDGIACSSKPQMQAQPMMYTSDPKHRLLCITTYIDSMDELPIVYVISTRIFFDLAEMAVAMPIPWKCWRPSNTRIFRCPMEHDGCAVHLSGNRVVLLSRVASHSRNASQCGTANISYVSWTSAR